MIVLSQKPNRVAVFSFLLSLGVLLTVLLSAMAHMLLGSLVIGALAGTLITGSALGLEAVRPGLMMPLYHRWNGLATWVAYWAEAWITRVTFRIVLTSVSLPGRGQTRSDHGTEETQWRVRDTLAREAYFGQGRRLHPDPATSRHWAREFIAWSFSSGNGWLIWMLPFMLLLKQIQVRRGTDVPDNIYTLY
jgi:hypothetical protein